MSWLAVFKDSNVPSSDTPGAPGARVVPAIVTILGAAVIAWPPIVVVIWGRGSRASGTVDVPTTRAEGPKYIGVPDTVMGGDPLVKVVPATMIASDEASMTWPAMVVVIGPVFLEKGTVDVPITRADEPRCIEVPDTVMGGAPGVSVVPAIEIPWESGWTTWLFIVLTWPWPIPLKGFVSSA